MTSRSDDPIEAAIAATEEPREALKMSAIEGVFAITGRPWTLIVPTDMAGPEYLDLLRTILVEVPQTLASQRSPIVVAKGVLRPQ